jgi:hypothetical protein
MASVCLDSLSSLDHSSFVTVSSGNPVSLPKPRSDLDEVGLNKMKQLSQSVTEYDGLSYTLQEMRPDMIHTGVV